MSPHSYQEPLLVTLALDDASQFRFQELRNENFPPARNIVPAHVTLFHALPFEQLDQISIDLARVTQRICFQIEVTNVRSMGRGVMYELRSQELIEIRNSLASAWKEWLIPQDVQKFRPHLVVQNKVTAEIARETFERLSSEFVPHWVSAKAIPLWRYRGGPWEKVRDFDFKQPAFGD